MTSAPSPDASTDPTAAGPAQPTPPAVTIGPPTAPGVLARAGARLRSVVPSLTGRPAPLSAPVVLPALYPPPAGTVDIDLDMDIDAAADAATRLWDRPAWAWSPDVQGRLREAVRRAAAGEVVSYGDTMRTDRNMLVTVDLTVSPVVSPSGVSGVVCSVLDAVDGVPAASLRTSRSGSPQHRGPEAPSTTVFGGIDAAEDGLRPGTPPRHRAARPDAASAWEL